MDQWVESTNRSFQNRLNLGNQQLAERDGQIIERDSRMLPNEHQLAATQQRLNVALVSPDLTNPSFEVLDSPNVFEDLNGIPSTAVQQPNAAANRLLSPTSLAGTPCGNSYNRATGSEPFPHQYAADSLQVVSVPTVVEATGRVTPLDSTGVQFTSDTSQVVAVPTAVGTTELFNPLVSNGFQFTSDPLQAVLSQLS